LNAAAQTGAANTFTALQSLDGGADIVNDHVDHFEGVASGGGNPTRMLFHQATAPTGWTKVTDAALDNHALRVVTSSTFTSGGGATAFTSVFGSGKTSGSHTLTTNEIPPHDHADGVYNGLLKHDGLETTGGTDVTAGEPNLASYGTLQNVGGGAGHSHPLSLDLTYIDLIIAEKD